VGTGRVDYASQRNVGCQRDDARQTHLDKTMTARQTMSGEDVSEMKRDKFRILVVDDHPLLRHSIRSFLETQSDFEVVGEGGNGIDAVRLASELHPDVVIMDIGMPGMNGLDATRQIRSTNRDVAVLVLTVHTDEGWVLEIMKAGASGYLIKDVFGDQLVEAVRGVLAGEVVLSPPVAEQLVKQAGRSASNLLAIKSGDRLTARDLTMIRLAASGSSNKEISVELGLTLFTVKTYFKHIYGKMGVRSRTEAVTTALREGLISVGDTR
jgi:DNA-binding NarL/FixJ family response regulator